MPVKYTVISRCSRCGKFCHGYFAEGREWSSCCDWPTTDGSHAIKGTVRYAAAPAPLRPKGYEARQEARQV